ncbi:hypothetical protein I6F36_35165 [Bradyrhizobium sp. BRP19]|uniref:hypothetical protein n=1 Tax=Bradyrhizobium sp. BRP19 TaxID=2793823 RepID=UPI001CD20719|nr:hypothetical protein [Bradyrhizobium sp. BRP19]
MDEPLRRGNEIKHCVGKPADIEKLLALNIPREFMPIILAAALEPKPEGDEALHSGGDCVRLACQHSDAQVARRGVSNPARQSVLRLHLRDDHELRPLSLNSMKGKRHSSRASLPLFAIAKRA